MAVKTGIKGFDQLVQGGFPENDIILVSGSAGTGKTIFCLEYIYHGAKDFNEPGVFISTEQSENDIRAQAKCFGWDLEALEKAKKMKLLYIDVTEEEDALGKIKDAVDQIKAKRLVIDSITTFTEFVSVLSIKKGVPVRYMKTVQVGGVTTPMTLSEKTVGKSTLNTLFKEMKALGCTNLVTSELPQQGEWLSRDTVSEFLSDGIVLLRNVGVTGEMG